MNPILIEALFVLSVILIWFMLVYQFILFLLGFLYSYHTQREKRILESSNIELPSVSILIPAHNEELVIDNTLKAITSLHYPKDRLEIIIVNDR